MESFRYLSLSPSLSSFPVFPSLLASLFSFTSSIHAIHDSLSAGDLRCCCYCRRRDGSILVVVVVVVAVCLDNDADLIVYAAVA